MQRKKQQSEKKIVTMCMKRRTNASKHEKKDSSIKHER
jgi:hypothetical protein